MTAPDPTAGERICDHDGCCNYRLCAHPRCCGYPVGGSASPPAVAASTGTSEDVEALVAWLVEQGGSPGSSLHSWRCEYPDRYGECDCLAESARDLLASDWLAAHDVATADRVRRETAEGIAQAIEANWSGDPLFDLGVEDSARIAREQAR